MVKTDVKLIKQNIGLQQSKSHLTKRKTNIKLNFFYKIKTKKRNRNTK